MTPARFYFDGMDPADGWIGTFDPREDWNGYAIPHFEPDVWARVVEFIRADGDSADLPTRIVDGRIVPLGLCFYSEDPRYSLIDLDVEETVTDDLDLAEFFAANDSLDPEDVTAIRSLAPGQSLVLGGGAAPFIRITRHS